MEQHVWGLRASTAWGTPATGHQGATWLELFTRYIMTGGIVQATQTDDPTTRLKRISPKQAMERFTKVFKRIVQTCLLPADRYLFRPAKTGERRLKRLAISSHLAAICTIPCWPQGTAKEVADEILAAGRGWNKEKSNRRQQGPMRLRPSKYILSSLPGERHKGCERGWCEHFRQHQRDQEPPQPRNPEDQGKPDSVIITCPTCNWCDGCSGQDYSAEWAGFQARGMPMLQGSQTEQPMEVQLWSALAHLHDPHGTRAGVQG